MDLKEEQVLFSLIFWGRGTADYADYRHIITKKAGQYHKAVSHGFSGGRGRFATWPAVARRSFRIAAEGFGRSKDNG